MKAHTQKKGFTLPELMMGMVTLAVLSLTVGLILIHGWRGWKGSNEAVEMQRDASIALDAVSREIRRSKFADMTLSSSGIRFAAGGVRSNSLAIFRDHSGALIHSQNGVDIKLFETGVKAFTPVGNVTNHSVTITLEYSSEEGYDYGAKTCTIFTRNDT